MLGTQEADSVSHCCLCSFADVSTVATCRLPVDPVESDAAQKGRTRLGVLLVRATQDKKVE